MLFHITMKTKSNFYFKMNEAFVNPSFYSGYAGQEERPIIQEEVHFSPYHEIEQEVILYDGLPLKVVKIEEFQDYKRTSKNLIIIDLVNPEPFVPPPEPKRFRQAGMSQANQFPVNTDPFAYKRA